MKVLDRGQEFPNNIRASAQVVRMDRMLHAAFKIK